jgi:branched-chain amino acid transport system substrate-binding protein
MSMIKRRSFLVGTAGAALSLSAPSILRAQNAPIKIGEINSYTTMAAFLGPYRNAWAIAVDEVNAAGGVLGRKIETVFRDDAGKPEDAVTHANELVNGEKVDLIAGCFFSNIGLAVSSYAKQAKKLYVASEPLTDALVWSQGNRYCFRLRPSTYMQVSMVVDEAAKMKATKWAAITYNYEYGQSALKWFKILLKAKRPDVEFVSEQFPPFGKLDAGSTAQAVAAAKPEAIFNTTTGPDLSGLVRQGNARGLFDGVQVISMLGGEPEYLDPLKDEAPEDWIVTGYPWAQIKTPEHLKFLQAYQARFKDYPRLGSVVAYGTVSAIVETIKKAQSTDTEKMVDAMEGISFPTPLGSVDMRAIDHQSTMGAYVGKTTVVDGKGTMKDWHYADGKNFMPPDAEVRQLRPKD